MQRARAPQLAVREAPAGPPGRGAPPLSCPVPRPCRAVPSRAPGAARPRPAVRPPGEAVAPPKRARGRRGRCSALPARAGPCPVSMSHVPCPCPMSRVGPCPVPGRAPCPLFHVPCRVTSRVVLCPCRAVPRAGPCPVSRVPRPVSCHIPCRALSRVVPCPVSSRAGPCRARCCPVPGRGRSPVRVAQGPGQGSGLYKSSAGRGRCEGSAMKPGSLLSLLSLLLVALLAPPGECRLLSELALAGEPAGPCGGGMATRSRRSPRSSPTPTTRSSCGPSAPRPPLRARPWGQSWAVTPRPARAVPTAGTRGKPALDPKAST